MKHLYILESARSIDSNNNPIPVKKLKWKPIPLVRIAWTDYDTCNRIRTDVQKEHNETLIRVHKLGFFKNIYVRLSDKGIFGDVFGMHWFVIDL